MLWLSETEGKGAGNYFHKMVRCDIFKSVPELEICVSIVACACARTLIWRLVVHHS